MQPTTSLSERREIREREQVAINRLSKVGEIRAAIEAAGEREHAAYPQYAGHWSGSEWKLGVTPRLVRTRLGVAFATGDVVLYREKDAAEREVSDPSFVTAYSVRNGIDTSVEARGIEPLATETTYRHPDGLVVLGGAR